MEALMKEQEKLAAGANLSKSVEDTQKIIDQLTAARDAIVADPGSATVNLAKLQIPIKNSFEVVNNDLKDVYKGHNWYQKVLDAKFKDKPYPTSDNDALSSQPGLINRAIAMHLLREGQFSVASQFLSDAQSKNQRPDISVETTEATLDEALGIDPLKSEDLRKAFANMYYILHEIREKHNLPPAIAWARENSDKLELRGSNLEFELGQLQFVYLFTGGANPNPQNMTVGRLAALQYAREHFGHFQSRYMQEIAQLASSMAYSSNLESSPYRRTFLSSASWSYVADAFTREFCSLLGLSADSPLFTAVTAGAIALPTLLKLQTIMKDKRAEWTTQQELPVEIPLPPNYLFHSIFVCPVSKEQTTDENPPMMLPCGHVIAHETMVRMSKGSRFKCPYCPIESRPEEARKLYL